MTSAFVGTEIFHAKNWLNQNIHQCIPVPQKSQNSARLSKILKDSVKLYKLKLDDSKYWGQELISWS